MASYCVASAPRTLKSGDPLEGSWSITVDPSGTDANTPGAKKFQETLTFNNNKMSTKTLASHGFGEAD